MGTISGWRLPSEAIAMLREMSSNYMPIRTVRIGYLHPNTFIRLFKKLVGQTPGDFRKTAN
ncbi:AraC family transcriptional regulator [Paenibacillus sp. N3.4]|uniref:AraC family transcriptional regulator n=1 Tax=Paenibacillus sp. N3.4 TaxID=2603222 RepID=UPI0011C72F5B|nr:AraC family transcriptional regulator [Paenibacillus sp. N3.4]TXK74144.1 AraC family transcriptional regulator [Paenibacillus sp. N3.4]